MRVRLGRRVTGEIDQRRQNRSLRDRHVPGKADAVRRKAVRHIDGSRSVIATKRRGARNERDPASGRNKSAQGLGQIGLERDT